MIRVKKEQNIIVKADEEEKKVTSVPSSELISDISLEKGVESAIEAKEGQIVPEEVLGNKDLLLESDAPTKEAEKITRTYFKYQG